MIEGAILCIEFYIIIGCPIFTIVLIVLLSFYNMVIEIPDNSPLRKKDGKLDKILLIGFLYVGWFGIIKELYFNKE